MIFTLTVYIAGPVKLQSEAMQFYWIRVYVIVMASTVHSLARARSSEGFILSALAIRITFSNEIFLSPRSTAPM